MEELIMNDIDFLFEMRNRYGVLYEIKENKRVLRDIIKVNYRLRNWKKENDFFFVPIEMKKEVLVYGGVNNKMEMLACIDTFHDLQKKNISNQVINSILPKNKCTMIKNKGYEYNNRRQKYKINKTGIYETMNDKNKFLLILDAISNEGMSEIIIFDDDDIVMDINKNTIEKLKEFGTQYINLDSFQNVSKIVNMLYIMKEKNIKFHILIDDTNIFDSSAAIQHLNTTLDIDNKEIINEVIFSNIPSGEITKYKEEMFNEKIKIILYGMNVINRTIDMSIIQKKINNYSNVYEITNTMGYISDRINKNQKFIHIKDKNQSKKLELDNIYDLLDIKRLGDYSQIYKCKQEKYIFFTPDFWAMVKAYEENIAFIFETPLTNKYIFYLPNNYIIKQEIKYYIDNSIEYNETTGELNIVISNDIFKILNTIEDVILFDNFYQKNNNILESYVDYIMYKKYVEYILNEGSFYSILYLYNNTNNSIISEICKQYIDKYCKLYILKTNKIEESDELLDMLYIYYKNKVSHINNINDKNNTCYLLHDFYSIEDFEILDYVPPIEILKEYTKTCINELEYFINIIENNVNEYLLTYIEDIIDTYNFSINNEYFHIVLNK